MKNNMRAFRSFFKKELTAQARTGKIAILFTVFILLAVMAPVITILLPKLLSTLGSSNVGGMTITVGEVTAVNSWEQFFGNASMAMIVFLIMEMSIYTKEYTTGTLVMVLTKGLPRKTALISKTLILTLMWTALWWTGFLVTYIITAVKWNGETVNDLIFASFCWWLFGLMMTELLTLFSAVAKTGTGVMAGLGAAFFGSMMISSVPVIKDYVPSKLMDAVSLLHGSSPISDYLPAVIATAVITVAAPIAGKILFDKKALVS